MTPGFVRGAFSDLTQIQVDHRTRRTKAKTSNPMVEVRILPGVPTYRLNLATAFASTGFF